MTNEELLMQANSELNHLVMDLQEKLLDKEKQLQDLTSDYVSLQKANFEYQDQIRQLQDQINQHKSPQKHEHTNKGLINIVQELRNKCQQITSIKQNNFQDQIKTLNQTIEYLFAQIQKQSHVYLELAKYQAERENVKTFLEYFENYYQERPLTIKKIQEIMDYQINGYQNQIDKLLKVIQEHTK